MPVVALFLSIELAIAITAVVHLANNLFKAALFAKHAEGSVLLRFGIPAILFALVGAATLSWLSALPPVLSYELLGSVREVSPIKLAVGLLILIFVMVELFSGFEGLSFDRKYLPVGGAISGFFGGVSGHQGAFRSMFLLKAGLTKEQFIGTGVLLAVFVDLSRLSFYGSSMFSQMDAIDWTLVASATLSAFAGVWIGARLVKKLTIQAIQLAVSGLLIMVSLGLMFGML